MANKLELTWYGKDEPILVEPRLLIENAALSNTAADPDTENMLIHGDNLLALKALESKYAGQVKCIYIDPPYNTGSAFEHYDDNLEHSQWLQLIRPRLEILWRLLADEGSIWISIDDDEQAYMKVLCDELFGREHFVSSMIWQKRTSPDMRAVISDGHEYILLYAKNRESFKRVRNKLPLSAEQASNYKNPDHDPRGDWTSADYTAQGYRPNQMYEITTPGGAKYTPPEGKCWKNIEEIFLQQVAENRIWFGPDGLSMPRRKTFLSEHEGVIPWTWWTNKEVGHNQEAKKEIISLFGAGVGNQILSGKMTQSFALPVCRETNEIIPQIDGIKNELRNNSWKNLTGTIEFTRFDDSKNVNYQKYLQTDNDNTDTDSTSTQMRYEVEYLVPGSQLYHVINLSTDMDYEIGVFIAALEQFSYSPVLGGMGGKGFGLCEAKLIADGRLFVQIGNGTIKLYDMAKNALDKYNQFISDSSEDIIKFIGAVKNE